MNRICVHCGCTYGSHHGGTSPWPKDYCPGHEGKMDWEFGPGTTFEEVTEGKMKRALEEIAKGEGAFSRDPLEHACNCIDNMKRIAQEVLK